MTIAWNHFTPYAALAGGILIGIAVALLLLFNGRIAGISGIVGGLLQPAKGDVAWRLAFVGGLLGAPAIYALWRQLPPTVVDTGSVTLVAAGLLVGIGTRYGSGCTSGHGVCGMSRLSPRSMAATGLFMAAGFGTVYLLRHVLGHPFGQ